MLNPATCWYDTPGKKLAPNGSLFSCTESVWNTLDPCSFSCFWNTASCKDNEVLEGMVDSMGKREIDVECVLSW